MRLDDQDESSNVEDRRRGGSFAGIGGGIGIGTVVALLSDTDRQAIQVSLLILLASVFFSGLAIDLDQFSAPVRVIGGLLPVTQAGTLLQDLLLRGAATDAWRMTLLAVMAAGLFAVGWLVLRRQMARPA